MHEVSEASLIKDFVDLSLYAGSRYDLVQAGGGNSSIKLDGERMLLKASGVHLSEVDAKEGYVTVRYPQIVEFLEKADLWRKAAKRDREYQAGRVVTSATQQPSASSSRASIEVFLHASLGRFVLHTHPIAVNMIACQKSWLECLTATFPDALLIPYHTPGIDLGLALYDSLTGSDACRNSILQAMFLQNHGLIVSGENMEDVRQLTEEVILKCESICEVDFNRYRVATELVSYLGGNLVAYLSNDRELDCLARMEGNSSSHRPVFPDSVVFCGVSPLVLENLDSPKPLQEYRSRFHDNPKVVLLNENHYFIAKSVKKAKEIEEVYKAHAFVLTSMQRDFTFLSDDELAYLGNWEAERYRSGR